MSESSLLEYYQNHKGKISDKWKAYLDVYERLFKPISNQPISLLEIGVQNGGSLEIWSKYFPNAIKLIGCDINLDCSRLVYSDPRIKIIIGNANSLNVQSKILEAQPLFDIIIDDGSHKSSDIITSFIKYFPYLKDNGIYVVEDLHASYWAELEGGLFHQLSSISFFKRLVDILNFEHWGLKFESVEILKKYKDVYQLEIDPNLVSHINSLQFFNSMCAIYKKNPLNNLLGGRVIAGNEENVTKNILNSVATVNNVPDQSIHIHHKDPIITLEIELESIKNKCAQLSDELEKISKSRSWRMTAPLRKLKRLTYG